MLAKARMCAESVSVCAEGRKQYGSARLNLPAAFLPNAFGKRNGTTFSSQTSEALVALTPPTPQLKSLVALTPPHTLTNAISSSHRRAAQSLPGPGLETAFSCRCYAVQSL